MRISKNSFSAEIHSVGNSQPHPGFRYLLFQSIDGEEAVLYESHLFRHKRNCIAKADEHLERLNSWANLSSRLLTWAA